MEEFPQIFNEFWNFLIPAIIELSILIVLTFLLADNVMVKGKILRLLAIRHRIYSNFGRVVFKLLGVKSVLSITIVVIVCISLVTLDRIIHSIGNRVPGSLSFYNEEALIRFSDTKHLAEIWNLYPQIDDLRSLSIMIESKLHSEWNNYSALTGQVKYLEERHERILSNREFLKFLIIYLALAPFILRKLGVGGKHTRVRIIFSYLVLSFLILNNFIVERQVIQQLNSMKTYIVRIMLAEEIESTVLSNTHEYEIKIIEMQEEQTKDFGSIIFFSM